MFCSMVEILHVSTPDAATVNDIDSRFNYYMAYLATLVEVAMHLKDSVTLMIVFPINTRYYGLNRN